MSIPKRPVRARRLATRFSVALNGTLFAILLSSLASATEPLVVTNLAELEAAVLTGRDIQVRAGVYPVRLILRLADGVTIEGEPGVQFDCQSLCLWAAQDNTIRNIDFIGGTVGVSGSHSMDLQNLSISNMNNGVYFQVRVPGEVAVVNVTNVEFRDSPIGLVASSAADATTLQIKIEDCVFENNPNGVIIDGGRDQASGTSTHVQVKSSQFSQFETGLRLSTSFNDAVGGRMSALVKSNTFDGGQSGVIGFAQLAFTSGGSYNHLKMSVIDNEFENVFFDALFAGGFSVNPQIQGDSNATEVNFARNTFTGFLAGDADLTFSGAIAGGNELTYRGSSVALDASSPTPPLNIEAIELARFNSGI